MQPVDKLSDIATPSHVVRCSGTKEFAFALALDDKKYWKRSWINDGAEEDEVKIEKINSQLPDCTELEVYFTGKLKRKLSEYYLGPKIIGFEDRVIIDIPDAIFLQRVSARTKTFDMVLFHGTTPTIIGIVDKSDLDAIRDWYPHTIYSCGADPLPLKTMQKWMESNESETMYSEIYEQLFNQEESSCSDYEPESDPESEDESCDESEVEEGHVSVSEIESESEEEEDYVPEEVEESEEDVDEPPAKKIKVSE